ncbi:MAG TPA: aminotransferase class V-fold PLP-dependent enzyme, partial [Polyangiaceae bacterium]|nr:aminotransferase class V-fold PLP-dependent enzyme [Polyangiaceae bacterium]
DVVLFVGSGATAAVNKLVGLLGITIPEPLEREHHLSSHIPEAKRPVVFVGPYEHHSNQLPWTCSIATIVEIALDERGCVSLADLQTKLHAFRDRPLKIGAFSAASNVTGLLTDVQRVATTLHRGGALAVFDYAASGPYVPIDMHPQDPDQRIDALVISPHKFMGGPNASGLLIAHRDLFRSTRPERPGGGTVDYVSGSHPDQIDYVKRLDDREEGGTPSIIGDLRAGVAFLLKEMVGPAAILEHEIALSRRALTRLTRHPRIDVYGPVDQPRLAILSFNVKGLHHDFVSTLLDHLFGIQNRAGCSCAGPYGHRLLGIDLDKSSSYRAQIARGVVGIKPGWVRVSLPYYGSDAEIEFVVRAIEFVAERGDLFLPLYRLCWREGLWQHTERPMRDAEPIELTAEALCQAAERFKGAPQSWALPDVDLDRERARYLEEAEALADDLTARFRRDPPLYRTKMGDPAIDPLIWFRFVNDVWSSGAPADGGSAHAELLE